MRAEGFYLLAQGHVIAKAPGKGHVPVAMAVYKPRHEDFAFAVYPFAALLPRRFRDRLIFATDFGDYRAVNAHRAPERDIVKIS